MKLKLTRQNGDVLDIEGTVEECAAIAGLASIGAIPPVHNHYHYPVLPDIGGRWSITPPPNNTPFVPSPNIIPGYPYQSSIVYNTSSNDGRAIHTTGNLAPAPIA